MNRTRSGLTEVLIILVVVLAWGPQTPLPAEDDAEIPTTHEEIEPIKIDLGPGGKIKTMAMNHEGNLLLGIGWLPEGKASKSVPSTPPQEMTPEQRRKMTPEQRREMMKNRGKPYTGDPNEDELEYAIKVVSPAGEVLATWPMNDGLHPHIIYATDNGYTYVFGGGKLAAFLADGERVKMIDTTELDGEQNLASGMCVGEKEGEHYLFLALGSGRSLRAVESIYRLDRDLTNPKMIIETQNGCCGHIDLEVRNGELIIPENSRHRVNRFDFEGNQLGTWGQRDRASIEGFAACCNPVNTDFGPDGVLYTAESGVGRVKKFTQEGKFLGMVGYVDTTKFDSGSALASQSCYIPVEVAPDGKNVYVMDVRASIVRVLAPKKSS